MSTHQENVFAHAVALDQSGRFRNAVHCMGQTVFIMNTDATALLRFILPMKDKGFHSPISFFANDYDSSSFRMEGGKVVFVQSGGEFVRSKACSVPKQTFAEVEELFNRFWSDSTKKGAEISINKATLSLLSDSLSHVEIYSEKGKPVIVQRDIFSGNTIELKRKTSGFGLASAKDSIPFDFGPIGLRTSDFMALFTFNDNVTFHFYEGNNNYCLVVGNNYDFCGIISGCMYDELNKLEVIEDGREKQKDGGCQPGADPKNQGGTGKKPVVRKPTLAKKPG